MPENQKISAFQNTVQSEVQDEIRALLKQAETESEKLISTAKDSCLNNSFKKIAEETKIIKTACKRKVSKQSFDSHRAVLNKRTELISEFFKKLEADLLEFTRSGEYKTYLNKKLNGIEEFMPFYDGVVIYVKAADLSNTELFDTEIKNKLTADKKIKIGGLAVYYPKERIYIDQTLDKQIRTEHEGFVKNKEIQL